jgi:hypothetical protein
MTRPFAEAGLLVFSASTKGWGEIEKLVLVLNIDSEVQELFDPNDPGRTDY